MAQWLDSTLAQPGAKVVGIQVDELAGNVEPWALDESAGVVAPSATQAEIIDGPMDYRDHEVTLWMEGLVGFGGNVEQGSGEVGGKGVSHGAGW